MNEHPARPDGADGEQLSRMLTELADDPDAPPSTVSASSVLAAVRAATVDGSIEDAAGEPDGDVPGTALVVRPRAVVATPPVQGSSEVAVPAGAHHRRHLDDDLAERRATRRRRGLIGLIAAAAVAAVAAVVIPLAVSRESSTTAADSAVSVAAGGTAPEGGTPQTGAERPAPGPDAITEIVPIESTPAARAPGESAPAESPPGEGAPGAIAPGEGEPGGSAAGDAGTIATGDAGTPAAQVPAEPSCWPALSDQAAAALTGALPAGSFGAPGPLNIDCVADPVAGALLTAPPTRVLMVQVTKADPGSCARSAGEAAVLCVPRSDGAYVSTNGGGMATAFAYGNGYQVQVGAPNAPGTAAPTGTGLTADQLVAAAQAVLGTLG